MYLSKVTLVIFLNILLLSHVANISGEKTDKYWDRWVVHSENGWGCNWTVNHRTNEQCIAIIFQLYRIHKRNSRIYITGHDCTEENPTANCVIQLKNATVDLCGKMENDSKQITFKLPERIINQSWRVLMDRVEFVLQSKIDAICNIKNEQSTDFLHSITWELKSWSIISCKWYGGELPNDLCIPIKVELERKSNAIAKNVRCTDSESRPDCTQFLTSNSKLCRHITPDSKTIFTIHNFILRDWRLQSESWLNEITHDVTDENPGQFVGSVCNREVGQKFNVTFPTWSVWNLMSLSASVDDWTSNNDNTEHCISIIADFSRTATWMFEIDSPVISCTDQNVHFICTQYAYSISGKLCVSNSTFHIRVSDERLFPVFELENELSCGEIAHLFRNISNTSALDKIDKMCRTVKIQVTTQLFQYLVLVNIVLMSIVILIQWFS